MEEFNFSINLGHEEEEDEAVHQQENQCSHDVEDWI